MALKRKNANSKLKDTLRNLGPTRMICLSFFGVIVLGALLLLLPFSSRAGHINIEDAFFTATSATCVTGLVVADTFQTFTRFGQIVILALIQVGGLGIVTIVAFFNFAVGRRLGLRGVRLAGESAGTGEAAKAPMQIKNIIKTALVFELAGAVLLSFYYVPQMGAEGLFTSVFLAISMFCNAGFDILSRGGVPFLSFTEYVANPYVLLVVALLIIGGGLGFVVWHDLVLWRKTKHLMLHTKVVLLMTAILLFGGTLGVFLMERGNPATLGEMPGWQQWLNAFFQSVSARTAGANSIDCAQMNDATKLLMSVLMFVGAASGSTGGGIKVTTLAVLAVTVISVVRGREDAVLFGHRLSKQTVYKALAIFFLAFATLTIATLTIYYNTGIELNSVDSIFEASSAFATVGLTIGATPNMNLVAKITTMLTMYIGRCGPVALATSLTLRAAQASRHEILPEGQILVG